MAVHRKKCDQKWFRLLKNGSKLFELRINDCDYQPGDIFYAEEIVSQSTRPKEGVFFNSWAADWKECKSTPTGETMQFEITFVITDKDGPWLRPGYVCLVLWPI